MNHVMPGSDGLRIWGNFLKKAVSSDLNLEKACGFLSWVRPVELVYEVCRAWWGQMELPA